MYNVHNSSTEHPDRNKNSNSLNADDLVIGSVRLRSVPRVFESIDGCGITLRGLYGWLRSLNIPILYIGRTAYINVRYFELAVHAITRPGSPDFMSPGTKQARKIECHPAPHTRELDTKFFEDNIQVFISELILARRERGAHKHHEFKDSVNTIVEAITRQYDLMDAPLAYHKRTTQAIKDANSELYRSEDPTQPKGFRVPSPTEQADPFLPPGVKSDDPDE